MFQNIVARFMSVFLLGIIILILDGCTPKDTALPSLVVAKAPNTYSGFNGLEQVETLSATKVKLTWARSSDPKVVAYNIYDVSLMFSPKLVKTVAASMDDTTLTNLDPAMLYVFRVRATDTNQTEDENTKDLGAIPYGGATTIDVLDSTSAVIHFNDASNADQALVYCSTLLDPVEKEMAVVTNVATTQVTLTQLAAGEQYSCRVALMISGIIDNNTNKVSFTPIGTASQLSFLTQPSSAAAGVNFSNQPVIHVKDAMGNVVASGPDSTAVITLTIASTSPTVGTLRGTASTTAVKGMATFSDLNIQEAGIKILTATKSDTSSQTNGSPSITANSNSFTISTGGVDPNMSSIAITPAPATRAEGLVANGSTSYNVVIILADQFGNPISGIKPVFSTSVIGDTLTQSTKNTDATGKATGTISTTIADMVAPYRYLSITSPTGLTSKTVEAPFVHGAATKLGFAIQPVNSPGGNLGMAVVKVSVQDAQGNIVSTGSAATSAISLAIASNLNGATLSGTTTVNAVNGVATFNDLGIDKTQTGYKLLASSGSYTPSYSNSFNVTAGVPQKIFIGGPATILSGSCSTALTIQLRDLGNNPANALSNTPVVISGLGSAQMFSSGACSGGALSTTLTFTTGTNTKTVYLKSPKAESINLAATDSSSVLTPAAVNFKFTPNKMNLVALSTLGGPFVVVAGQCSTALVVTTAGDNGVAGPIFTATPVAFTGLSASAQLYYDSGCTNLVDPMNATLPVSVGVNYSTSFYIKNPKAEILSLSVVDPTAIITTTSIPQSVSILPSKITFTGPSSVVSGQCSTAFTVTLKDELNNSVVASSNTTLAINGLSGSADGQFYTSSSCTGGGFNSALTIPTGSSLIQVYFKDSHAETLSLSISDPNSLMASSAALSVGISPSALEIVGPVSGNTKTTVCAGPFTIRTLDGGNALTAAITPITVNLTGAGAAGAFFTESSCSQANKVTQFIFSTGDSTKTFYFQGQYPETLILTATDAATVLSPGIFNFSILGAPGWLGTRGTQEDENGNFAWFQLGVAPVASQVDAARSVFGLHFDATKKYLYVTDVSFGRILKYDYTNRSYIGWIGRSGGGITGSNLTTPSDAACVSTIYGATTPGWCVGGVSESSSNVTAGQLWAPVRIADDGNYIYVAHNGGHMVSRHNAETGAFAGWIGNISSTPTSAAPGGPASCTTVGNTVTPGWCIGGAAAYDNYNGKGDGSMRDVHAIAYSNGSLFVGRTGAVLKFNAADGSFQGWIGMVYSTPPAGGAVGCAGASENTLTPGWCTGGTFKWVNPRSHLGIAGGFHTPVDMEVIGSTLYVLHNNYGGVVNKYDVETGAFLGTLSSLTFNWWGPIAMRTDGTNLYFADEARVLKTDLNGLILGWIGKVSNNSSMSGSVGCSTLVPNANTPGWCLGGTAKVGVDERSFHHLRGLEIDSDGSLLTGQGAGFYPGIKKWSSTTGEYQGMLSYRSTSPREWSNDAATSAQLYGFDDHSMYAPQASYVNNGYLYLVEQGASRIKKIKLSTGEVIGWIGIITTVPTGGDPTCALGNPMTFSPGWCLGAMFNPNYLWNQMVSNVAIGNQYTPAGITGDGTYLYVTDYALDRISKFNMSTGAFVGWIGKIVDYSPTGGAPGCAGAPVGSFTPGWCLGGYSDWGSNDGALANPNAITYVAATGNLYVIDRYNHRVSSYNANTGAFNGWIGRIGSTNPTSGCTYGSNGSYNVSQSGWCKGGTSQSSVVGDIGGGFLFANATFGGITSDGTYLYIANYQNYRIDKFSLGGVYQGSVNSRFDGGSNAYAQTWTTDPAKLSSWTPGCSYPSSLWMDGTTLYGTGHHSCGYGGHAAWKLNATTGSMIGWQGAISSNSPPVGGDAGCPGATLVTPGWCQGGGITTGNKMGQFSGALQISGDGSFVYVSDENSHRLTRLPK